MLHVGLGAGARRLMSCIAVLIEQYALLRKPSQAS